ncbi:hypothetical protein XH97_34795 [Bradyrhizobium sp. CCBAU 53380]|nr:hypothetical protein [Bradyrhizobium sp. CCBAU 53380]
MEAVIPVIISAAAVAVVTVGNAEHAFHRTDRATDTGSHDASDRAAHRTGDPVAFMRAFLSAAHDALGVASLRQGEQRKKDGCGCEQQADRQAGRQGGGGSTGFVHLQSQRKVQG